MEHVPIDTPQMIGILRAVAGTPASPIVRLPWNDLVMVKRALDAGAQSLMFPFVQDEREAARAVAATRYPPDGIRGAAGVHRASRYGTIPNYFRLAAAELCVIVQIETAHALERLAAIAEVPGVDECRPLGKPCGIVGPNPDMVARFVDYGYSWVAVGSDMSMMVGRAQEWLGKLRGSAAPAPKPQGAY
jgi:2-dehydro-3-deoxyglucarate aldolase/4-hydroxy-2-oxoheptanedioate aldolase